MISERPDPLAEAVGAGSSCRADVWEKAVPAQPTRTAVPISVRIKVKCRIVMVLPLY